MNSKIFPIHIITIGKSRGIALPEALLKKFPTDKAVIEETEEGILIRPRSPLIPRSEWEAIFKAESQKEEAEDWSEWDVTLLDGLDEESN